MINTIATNITRARQRRGLTMEELASMVNCSKQAISHYENGLRYPDSKMLLSIAEALRVDIEFFYSACNVEFSMYNVSYREGAWLTDRQKSDVEELTSCKLNDYLELENIAKESVTFQNPLKDILVGSPDDVEKAAKALRKKWGLGEGAIANIINFLERKGVRVIKIDFQFGYRHEGLSGWAEENTVPVIVLNAKQSDITRMRFTLLHELGHLLLIIQDGLDDNMIERLCDAFAGAVLLPAEVLVQEFGRNRTAISMAELRRIKELYGISVQAIMVRARVTNLIPYAAYEKWKKADCSDCDYGQYQGAEEPQKFLQMLYRCLSEKKIGYDKAAKLAGISENELIKSYAQHIDF